MQKAKQAVADFVSHDGKHKTTVHEDTRTAVTDEHVRPHQHENITTAVDKEVHQDHHHTTIQPVKHQEVLPEQHKHNVIPVEHKTIHHGNESELRENLARDNARFKDTSVTHGTTHTATTAPVVAGERTHHHVHEHVQPVIQKETIAPQVVHTTVPVHETHHAAAVHHGTSVLPTETMDSFTNGSKGTLGGRATTKVAEFDGPPKSYNNDLQTERLDGDKHLAGLGSTGRTHDHTSTQNASGLDGVGHNTRGAQSGAIGSGTHNNSTTAGTTGTTGAQGTKPSLLQKLNPMKDADGDGKKGLMD